MIQSRKTIGWNIIFYDITCITAKNCDQMLRAEAATTVCSRLMDPDPTGQLLFRSVDILWNMLENGDQGQLAEQLNNLSCIRYCDRPKK